jgi:hypothetical protein
VTRQRQRERQRRLRRSIVIGATTLFLAATATGSAVAWNDSTPTGSGLGSSRLVSSAIAVEAVPVVSVRATAPAPSTPATVRHSATRAPRTKALSARVPAPRAPRSGAATPRPSRPNALHRTISHYVDAPGSQQAIDRCNLVLWTHAPLWLAAHNYCGYQWLAFVPTGTTVTVSTGPARGTFLVTGHVRLSRQSGSLPHLDADLVLQTCVGASTGLTLLHRV